MLQGVDVDDPFLKIDIYNIGCIKVDRSTGRDDIQIDRLRRRGQTAETHGLCKVRIGYRLDQVMYGIDRIALPQILLRLRQKDQAAVKVLFPDGMCHRHSGHSTHINIQKHDGEPPRGKCLEKCFSAVKFI